MRKTIRIILSPIIVIFMLVALCAFLGVIVLMGGIGQIIYAQLRPLSLFYSAYERRSQTKEALYMMTFPVWLPFATGWKYIKTGELNV